MCRTKVKPTKAKDTEVAASKRQQTVDTDVVWLVPERAGSRVHMARTGTFVARCRDQEFKGKWKQYRGLDAFEGMQSELEGRRQCDDCMRGLAPEVAEYVVAQSLR